MNKGDKTPKGIYIGEAMVDREKSLTKDELEALPEIYVERTPVSSPDIFRDRAIAYVFDDDGKEVTVLVEDFKK